MDVRTLCLGVLSFGDATGYEIKKYFEGAFSHFFVAGYGSIYPALAELAEEGLVRVRDQIGDRRAGAKVYQLTETGREAFRDAIVRAEPRHKVRSEFLVILYFAHMLPPARLRSILDERLLDIESLLDSVRQTQAADSDTSPGVRFVAGFGSALLQAARDYIVTHRRELESTAVATTEHSGTVPTAAGAGS
jgi:DNA-binding PadR family transcriptional regulator